MIEAFGRYLDKLFDQFQDLELMVDENNASHTYAPGGQDQIAFVISSTNFFDFIEIEAVQKAIRLFNLRLMRKGATIYNRYHSFDLSRVIFED